MRRAAFTICSWNYFSYARTLANSFIRFNRSTDFFVFIADRPQQYADYLGDDGKVIIIDEKIVPNLDVMSASYSIMEFNTAVKPFCIKYLVDALRFEGVCYLDPDIFVMSPLDDVFDLLELGFDCVLTPHITQPYDDRLHPGDLEILRAGVYNLGFIAFSNRQEARSFIGWWSKWLETDCVVNVEQGIFVDQRFCDFIPAFIEKSKILRDPGYNVAYWNLVHRQLQIRQNRLYCGDSAVRFIHFSGVDRKRPEMFSKHQNRFTRENIGVLQAVFDEYIGALNSNDIGNEVEFSQVEYGFANLPSGVRRTEEINRCIRRYKEDFFETMKVTGKEIDFFTKVSDQFRLESGHPVNRLVNEIFSSRKDLQESFDTATLEGRSRLNDWAKETIFREYGIPSDWAECRIKTLESPLRQMLEASTRAPQPNEVVRIVKLFGFFLRSLLSIEMPIEMRSQKQLDDLAWNLAFSHDCLPKKARKALFERLKIASNSRRYELFLHWLKERGVCQAGAQEPCRFESSENDLVSTDLSPAPTVVDKPGLAIYGFLNMETGLGEAGRGLARAFATTKYPLTCHSITVPGFENSVQFPTFTSMQNDVNTVLLAINADNTMNLGHLIDSRFLLNKRKFGLFFWELPVFPSIWSGAFNKVDEVLVSSHFIAESLGSVTTKPVHVIPLPVALNNLETNSSRNKLGLPSGRLLYLLSFDYNSFPTRKNAIGAVRAYIDAFPTVTESSQMLIIKSHGAGNRTGYADELHAIIADRADILEIDRVMTRDEMTMLQAAIDVYISLHRSEGFGLNIAECMAAGKLVVATDFSGNVDFTSSENSIPIPYEMGRVRRDEYVAWQGQWWAEPSHEHAVEALRLAAQSSDLRFRLGSAAKQAIASQLSYQRVGRLMEEVIFGAADCP